MNYSGKATIEFPIYRVKMNGDEVETILTVKGNSYYHRGKIYGDPETCYSDEGGTEIESITTADEQPLSFDLTRTELEEVEAAIDLSVQNNDYNDDEDDFIEHDERYYDLY
jgi:hypothetical protein